MGFPLSPVEEYVGLFNPVAFVNVQPLVDLSVQLVTAVPFTGFVLFPFISVASNQRIAPLIARGVVICDDVITMGIGGTSVVNG